MLTLATLLLFALPPRALPPAAMPPAAPLVPVGKPQVEPIPGATIGSVKVESIPPPAQPPATTAPRWVAPVAPAYPQQPVRRMYYQPPSRSCVNGRCYVTPGYWYYR